MAELQELTAEERLEMMGEKVSDADRAFHQTWRAFNRRVGFQNAVSVVDYREIDIMKAFWQAGMDYQEEK